MKIISPFFLFWYGFNLKWLHFYLIGFWLVSQYLTVSDNACQVAWKTLCALYINFLKNGWCVNWKRQYTSKTVRVFVIFGTTFTTHFVHYIVSLRFSTSECASNNLEQTVRVLSGLRHENRAKSTVVERLIQTEGNKRLSKSVRFNCFRQIDLPNRDLGE